MEPAQLRPLPDVLATMLRKTLLSALFALLAAAPASHAADRCRPRAHERVAAHDAQAVALVRRFFVARRGERPVRVEELSACAATGRRRLVERIRSVGGVGPHHLGQIRLAGPKLTYVVVSLAEESTHDELRLADAVHGGRRHTVAGVRRDGWPEGDATLRLGAWAVGPQGAVAWVQPGDAGARPLSQLLLFRPPGDVRLLDSGWSLGAPAVDGDHLTWRHGGDTRSLPLAPTPDACAAPATGGTAELDIGQTPTGVTACLRSSGARLAVGGSLRLIDVAGPYVALRSLDDQALTLMDLAKGAAEPFPADVTDLRVDASGSVAWIRRGDGYDRLPSLWVRDAAGTREIPYPGPPGPFSLSRDDQTVVDQGGSVVTLGP